MTPDGQPATDGPSGLELRAATAGDADRLLTWANDPLTRAMSFHREPIDRSTHERWLAGRLQSADTRLYIGWVADQPVGQVRFERDPGGDIEVSISVAPEARGRGLGRALLGAGLAAARDVPSLAGRTVVARVRAENAASIRLFDALGFRRRPDGDPGTGVLVFELPV